MNICFINVSIRPDAKTIMLPNGLAYVMTAVKNQGFSFDFFDMDVNKYTTNDLESFVKNNGGYDIFLFGCIVSGFKYGKRIAECLRSICPNACIIVGNSMADAVPELTLRRTEVDICVLGEGDDTVPELLRYLSEKKDWHSIQGIAYLDEQMKFIQTQCRPYRKDFDSYGFPDWSIFDLKKYEHFFSLASRKDFHKNGFRPFPMNTARGCPFHCTFCYIVVRNEKIRYRSYSENAIRNELIRLHDEFGANHVDFWDDNSFITKKQLIQRLETIESLPFEMSWTAAIRAGLFDKKDGALIRRCAATNCLDFGFSLESADPEILKAIDKQIEAREFIEQCKVLWENGIQPSTSIIFGYPQETKKSIHHTLEVCKESGVFPSSGFLLPLPGTKIYQWCLDHGKITDEYEYLMQSGDRQDLHINLTSLSDDELENTVKEELQKLAEFQGLHLQSVMKTVVYQTPKNIPQAKK